MSRRKRRSTPRRRRGYELTAGAVHPGDRPPEAEPWITRKCQTHQHRDCPACDCRCHAAEVGANTGSPA